MLRKNWIVLGAVALISAASITAFALEELQKPHTEGEIQSSNGGQCRLFGEAQAHPAGDYPMAVAVGDFDGDGLQDLALANMAHMPSCWGCSRSHVSVLLGLGDGSFGEEQSYGTGKGAIYLEVGDVNRDGVQDLAVANRYSYDVSVLSGVGDGRFRGEARYGQWDAVATFWVAIGDFDGDGWDDLVTANAYSADIQLLRGISYGRFRVYARYEVGYDPRSVAVGDFDGDGVQDLAVGDGGPGKIEVLRGLGDGLFEAAGSYDVGNLAIWTAVGDFDRDGVPDLAVAAWATVAVLRGLGDGSFADAQHYDTGPGERSIAVGDFDGDDVQDLVVGHESDHVSVLLGSGDGNFGPSQRFPVGPTPGSVAVGDFDGDGAQDVVVTDRHTDNVFVLLNECSTIAVDVAIKPQSDPSNINPRSRGVIPVAILGDDSFDVADVDEESLRFGPAAAPIAHRHAHFEDVNYDGIMDLVTHYRTQDTGIVCADESATLTGATLDGHPIEGSDSIQTVGCHETRRPAIWMKDQNRPDTVRRSGPVAIERK